MALGTITAPVKQEANGHLRADLISFLGDSSYPTGGTAAVQALIRTALGAGNVEILGISPQDCGGYMVVWDYANGKLKCFHSNDDGGADGPLIEVPNATDLSSVTFKVLVISR